MSLDYHSQYPPASPYPQQVPISTPRTTPLVTYTLLGLSVVIFILQWATESFLGFDYPAALGLKVNELIIQSWILKRT